MCVALDIVRMGEVAHGAADQLRLPVAEELAEAGVDAFEEKVAVDHRDPEGTGLEDPIERLVEEMETAAAAQVAAESLVPFLGIRVLSNNITNGGEYDVRSAAACQQFVLAVVRAYLTQQRLR